MKEIDFGGNTDHVHWGSWLYLFFNVTHIRTVGVTESYPTTLSKFYPAFLTVPVIKGDCWALAEVCTLPSAILVSNVLRKHT